MKPFDSSGTFKPNTGEMRRLAVRGAAATLLSSSLGLAIQIVATVVLARLLTPADFGVVTMVTTFSLLLANFGFNGFTEAIIQRDDLNHSLASNLFWINLGSGIVLTAGFALAGSLLARFYGNPLIESVAAGVSLTILFSSTWVLHTALLKRAMCFTAVSANDVCARAVAVVVSIVFGWAGWGHWALVIGAVSVPFATTVGAWTACRWVPGLPLRVAGTASMVRFAVNVYGRFTVNYCARNMDNLLVGWSFNAQALGFYKKAYDLFALSAGQLVSPLTHVAVATLSRLNRNSMEYRRYLLSALGVVAFVGMGVGADLTLVGADVIRLLLGSGWEPSGPIFTFFGPGIGIMMVYGTHGWIHLSIGRADRWFRWGIVEFVITGLLFLMALPWGPVGIAAAWTASFWILTIPALWYAGKPIRLPIKSVIAAVWKFVFASVLASVLCMVIIRELQFGAEVSSSVAALTRIVAVSLLFSSLYLAAVILLHRGGGPLYQLGGLLREMIPWSRFRKASSVSTPNRVADAFPVTGGKE